MLEHTKIEELTDRFKEYINTSYELKKMEAIEAVTAIEASLISRLLVGLVVLFFILFSSLAIGYYLSNRLGDFFLGFMIVAGFYLILSLILLLVRKRFLERTLQDKLIHKIFKS